MVCECFQNGKKVNCNSAKYKKEAASVEQLQDKFQHEWSPAMIMRPFMSSVFGHHHNQGEYDADNKRRSATRKKRK